ncbi:hypothetical protein QQS21_009008 [Conoideocrella luteorostrata]|uniref:Uncharacterized protein n=1 Tax=Conoideocrella luteorostrata TaxID=1105319 RepID=A0AAJ0CKF6_9HYPO|nr:hypothetical protein QQS21_009008 [Conoideocrella luteorostrata]
MVRIAVAALLAFATLGAGSSTALHNFKTATGPKPAKTPSVEEQKEYDNLSKKTEKAKEDLSIAQSEEVKAATNPMDRRLLLDLEPTSRVRTRTVPWAMEILMDWSTNKMLTRITAGRSKSGLAQPTVTCKLSKDAGE